MTKWTYFQTKEEDLTQTIEGRVEIQDKIEMMDGKII